MFPYIRIILYSIFASMASRGYITTELAHELSSDPVVVEGVMQLVGVIGWVLTMSWYRIAKKFGWKT